MTRRRRLITRSGQGGTRFRVYPQPPVLAAYRDPITVELSPPAGSVGVGPHDHRMCVIAPIGKRQSYGQQLLRQPGSRPALPPWRGPVRDPARPGPGGSFDHLDPSDPTFAQAHAFACVRLALDVWENYLGRTVPWYFAQKPSWLEIGLLGEQYDNGEVGWGWLELGADSSPDRPPQPFALNLDVIAHEVGHLIVYGIVGEPSGTAMSAEYMGFHESAADLVALLVSAHLEPVVDRVLARTRGNLYVANELNRLGELSATTQLRIASNSARMEEFALGWSNEHDLSEPLTGAVFDLMIDLYEGYLVERGAIPASLAAMVAEVGHLRSFAPTIQAEFDRWYPRGPELFGQAFADARDDLGRYLARAFARLTPERLTYTAVQRALAEADLALNGGRMQQHIQANFAWRGIGQVTIGPYLGSEEASRAHLLRMHRCASRETNRLRSA